MELARAVGHLLLDPVSTAGVLGAGSSTTRATGPRRRRSGAFAAELVLPTSGVRKLLDELGADAQEEAVFEATMRRFGVGARTAAYHLWNHGFLVNAQRRDALIDEYAMPPG